MKASNRLIRTIWDVESDRSQLSPQLPYLKAELQHIYITFFDEANYFQKNFDV